MKFENPIPLGGSIRITFDDKVFITNSYQMENSCYRLDYSADPLSLKCDASIYQLDVQVS